VISRADLLEEISIREEQQRRKAGRRLERFYPDEGPLRRELYPKHLEFFRLGAHLRGRLFTAATRVGRRKALAASSSRVI